MLNFENDIEIDLDDLHMEWANHAARRKRYADEVSRLEDIVKVIHQKEKVLRSKLIMEAKEKGQSNAILQEAYYRTHPTHEKIKQERIQAEYNLSMGLNALRAMDDRKFALENEVELWKRDYFAPPRERRPIPGKTIDNDENQKALRQRTGLNRKRNV